MKLSNAFLRGVNSGISFNRGSLVEKYADHASAMRNPSERDCASIKGDWENVGKDIKNAIKRYAAIK